MASFEIHSQILASSLDEILGHPETGAIAFIRCLTPDVVDNLVNSSSFELKDWQTFKVAADDQEIHRCITADRAVELREAKGEAVLLIVDTVRAGAGMDGIYSAAREVSESDLFDNAIPRANHIISKKLPKGYREFTTRATEIAGRGSRRDVISSWSKFDFLCQVIADSKSAGSYISKLNLWPLLEMEVSNMIECLTDSQVFVDRLLSPITVTHQPKVRVELIRLDSESDQRKGELVKFLHEADTRPLHEALSLLQSRKSLWIGNLRREPPAKTIKQINLTPWRGHTGGLLKWSGLRETGEINDPPELILANDGSQYKNSPQLEVRWKVEPVELEKNSVEYRVSILTDQEEEITCEYVSHSARKTGERVRFNDDHFSFLHEDAVVSVRVKIEVTGDSGIDPEESEDFVIRFGDISDVSVAATSGQKVRTFSEGVVELGTRETLSNTTSSLPDVVRVDAKGKLVLQLPFEKGRKRYFSIERPALIADIEDQWRAEEGALGRWTVKVRASGLQAGPLEFVRIDAVESDSWLKTEKASRKFVKKLGHIGSICQIYDDNANDFVVVQDYLRSWNSLLSEGEPNVCIANTLEVLSLTGETIGLIVLPFHPLRVAWHCAYDNLVLNCAYEENQTATDIRRELSSLDGALFPAFLPNPKGGVFVFSDTLGFHSIGMVPDSDLEPKAAISILARTLSKKQADYLVPVVGEQSIPLLTNEILKYLDCHELPGLVHIHTLRAGDGFTIARALGQVLGQYQNRIFTEVEQNGEEIYDKYPRFSLEFYPSADHHEVSGRFILEAREKRRSGAGVHTQEDKWMLESMSLSGNVIKPRLRWARKETEMPNSTAHLAVAFDTLESKVIAKEEELEHSTQPFHTFGLQTFYDRQYFESRSPEWTGQIPVWKEGVKHPSNRTHTEILVQLHERLQSCVAGFLNVPNGKPMLSTKISANKAEALEILHQLSDWVITLDRNAGLEYFDSPKANHSRFDAYVIDCVPERTDLSSLQLITSTTNLAEVCELLDDVLDEMGLSRSERNSKFLLDHLKALSGRLAIRLTGQKLVAAELVALAASHANCRHVMGDDEDCWLSLTSGFFIPCDDVRDLLPPLSSHAIQDSEGTRPDLIYVSLDSRKRLQFQFIEIKFRRHLRNAWSSNLLEKILDQTEGLRERWDQWYSLSIQCETFLSIRISRLARVLRFYVDKAHRHTLPDTSHIEFLREIEKMVEKGSAYTFGNRVDDRGWVFCSEYLEDIPTRISPEDCHTGVFLFGPAGLPDTEIVKNFSRNTGDGETLPQWKNNTGSNVEPDPVEVSQTRATTLENDVAADATIQLGSDHHVPSTRVGWTLGIKGNPHLLIAGQPGMGKTTCLVNICEQLKNASICPIIFSYHQDIDERIANANPNLRFVDVGSLGFNPLQVIDRNAQSPHLDVAGAIRDIFVAIFPELGDIQADCIRRAVRESFVEVGWSSGNTGQTEPEFKRFVEIIGSDPKPDQGLRRLRLRLEELVDYGFFEQGNELHQSLWESTSPTIIRIHKTQNENLQRAFAYLVFYGMYKDMFRRGVQDRITHALILDEAHRASRLKLIPTMAKECRKFGISLILASQESKDFDASVFSAIANYLVLRTTDLDAKYLVRNVAKSKDEKPLVDKIKQLDRFNALFFQEGRTRPSYINLLEHF